MNQIPLAQYYALTADAIESVYDKPERQEDLAWLRDKVADLLEGHTVLELACGTGYWTRVIAPVADAVHATDIGEEVLALARERQPEEDDNVTFAVADAWHLPESVGEYTAVFAGFWWSHVKREEQDRFLAQLRAKVGKDVLLVLLDNTYVDGSSTVIARTDLEGNTYQFRLLPSGERVEVLKNFATDSYLRKRLSNAARDIRIERLPYYWLAKARLK
ncbi:methyltransferase family protein [Pseudoduganella lurida]|uniref:Methyltransferase family protein n=1 Tax=Pseudoduganella lurida TaxID=1036180 RepID=A0A562R7P0_9BURK|nr:class I SAM-dependent methyltransferase [Pseudoduganella lurida]TWI65077.1 methyltransferase family protein [Pseudoduganella lurida]